MNLRWIIICMLFACGFTPLMYSDSLNINEFMVSNVHFRLNPFMSDFEDWIELYNAGESPIELGGLYMTDDLSDPFKWQIAGNPVIQPKSFYIIWADGLSYENHASFKLSGDGEQIGLYRADGTIIDTITFLRQPNDISFGRFPDGGDAWYYFSNPTFQNSNSSPGLSTNRQVLQPAFSPKGGLYSEEVRILLTSDNDATIHYTWDGTIPTIESEVYDQPITLQESAVLRARAFRDGKLPSEVITHSYIINEPTTLPVISICTPPAYLFDEEIGITVGICKPDEPGTPPPFDMTANYWNKWERPIHIEYFTREGLPGFRQDAGIAIFGGFLGRQLRQKAFTLYARNKYGDSDFDFPLFPSKPINSYRRFILRCSSNDYNRTFIRDAMMNTLVIGQMDVDYQAYQPVLVYINGTFWGLYNMREKMNQFYPEINYGIEADSVDLIEGFDHVAHGGGGNYHALIQFVEENDMSLDANYQYVQTQMDMVEFMNYYITEIYVNNHDWLHQNIKCWREHHHGKWRWLLYDMDWGFSGEFFWMTEEYKDNTLQWVLDQGQQSLLFRNLIMNHDFKTEFAQRFVTHLNLTFRPERVHQIISNISQTIEPEIPRQIERWGALQSMEYWNGHLNILHMYAESRPFHMLVQLVEILVPEEKRELILEVSNEEAGWVSVFDAPCPAPLFGGSWYRNIPVVIRAHAKPGWRFVRWEGTFPSQEDSLRITLEDNAILHAVFEPYDIPKLVISEIHYNPSTELQGSDEDFEFIELVNWESERTEISGFRFEDGIEYIFPQGSFMEAGEYIILATNPTTYANSGCRVFQIASGKLNNAGEKLRLVDQEGVVIDEVHFDDHYPWPRKPDGEGPSLILIHPSFDNSRANSWIASEQTGGSPGNGVTGVDISNEHAAEEGILTIWPNPIVHRTRIRYNSTDQGVHYVRVFNSFGQEVDRILDEFAGPGLHELMWEPGNLSDGIYYIQVMSSQERFTQKVVILRNE